MTTIKPAPVAKLSSLIATEDAEWQPLPDVGENVRVKVRPIDYPPYTLARALLFKRLARTYKDAPIPDKVRVTELGKLYAEHILIEWDGFDVPYSREEALSMLSVWEGRRLTEMIEFAASKCTIINAEFMEQVAKN